MTSAGELESTIVRHCEGCGELDLREQWESWAFAEEQLVSDSPWMCPACGDHRFLLVELFPGGMYAYGASGTEPIHGR